VKILNLVEIDAVFLPEFLGVAWAPSQLSSVNLVSEFFNGAENLLVIVEVLE